MTYCVDHIFSKAQKKKEIELLKKAGAEGIHITSLFEEHWCGINTKTSLYTKTTEECTAQLYDGVWKISRRGNELHTIEHVCQQIKDLRERKIMTTRVGKLRRTK